MRKMLVAFVLLAVCCLSNTGLAQFQRMAFGGGEFTIGGGGSVSREAFCIDGERDPPPNGHLLTSFLSGDAQVTIGKGPPMSLGAAISSGRLRAKFKALPNGDFAIQFENPGSDAAVVRALRRGILGDQSTDIEGVEYLRDFKDGDTDQFAIWDEEGPRNLREVLSFHGSFEEYISKYPRSTFLAFAKHQDHASVLVDSEAALALSPNMELSSQFCVLNCDKESVTSSTEFLARRDNTGKLEPETYELLSNYDVRIGRDLADHSTSEVTFCGVDAMLGDPEHIIKLRLGKESFPLKESELLEFVNTGTVSESVANALSSKATQMPLVVYRNSISRSAETRALAGDREHSGFVNATQFARRLQAHLGASKSVFLDDEMDLAAKNAASQPTVTGGHSIVVFDDPSSMSRRDSKIAGEIEDRLRDAGIEVVRKLPDLRKSSAPNVIVITGHKTPLLQTVMNEVVTHGGVKNKLLCVFSCGQPGEEAFNSSLLQDSARQLRGVLFFSDKIDQRAVQEVLIELGERARDANPRSLRRLLNEAVDAAKSKDELKAILPEIEKLRHGVIQISKACVELSIAKAIA